MRKSLLAFAAAAFLCSGNAMADSVPSQLYLIGHPALTDDPTGGWHTNLGLEMTPKGDGVFYWSGDLRPSQYFGFATELNDDNDWVALNKGRYSPASSDTHPGVTVDAELPVGTIGKMDLGTEGAWYVDSDGWYEITVDTKNLTISANAEIWTPTDNTWGVIGSFNYWDGDVEMTETTTGVYTVTMDSIQGEFKFRANQSWDLQYGAPYNFDITGNINGLELDTWNGKNFNAPEPLRNVTFTLNTNHNTLSISGLPTDMELETPAPLYMIGEPAGEWSPAVGIEMSYQGKGIYSWSGDLIANQYLAFVDQLNEDGDWALLNEHRYGPAQDGEELPANGNGSMVYPKDGAWKVPADGWYSITVDTKSLTISTYANIKVPLENLSWGMIGGFNGWSGDEELTKIGDGVFSITVESLPEGEEFKFRADGEWTNNLGTVWGTDPISSDCVLPIQKDGSNIIAGEGFNNITLTIDVINYTMTVTGFGSTGVDTIGNDNEAPVYFNLQGIPVENPKDGIFIRVANGKTSKVAL